MANEDTKVMPADQALKDLDDIADNSLHKPDEIITIKADFQESSVIITRRQVYNAAILMGTNHHISQLFGIDKNTLAKNFGRELKMARAFTRQKLFARLYNEALYGTCPADRIFALKNWANFTDTGLSESIDELEEGISFVVRRPVKPLQKIKSNETLLETIEEVQDHEES